MLRSVFPYIEVGLIVKAASETVWNTLIDTSRWVEWGPSIRAVESSERFLTALSSGRVRTVLGFSVPFAVSRFEPGKCWSWRVFGIPATTHTVESLGAHRSRLFFGVPLPAFPYLLVCLIAIRRLVALIEWFSATTEGIQVYQDEHALTIKQLTLIDNNVLQTLNPIFRGGTREYRSRKCLSQKGVIPR